MLYKEILIGGKMAYSQTRDTEEIARRIIHYMVNKLEEEGYSKEGYDFNLDKSWPYSEHKQEALDFVCCSEEDFYKGLNKCIAREYISGPRFVGIPYGGLKLLLSEENGGINKTDIHVNGGFNQFGNGNTQNNGW